MKIRGAKTPLIFLFVYIEFSIYFEIYENIKSKSFTL